MGEGSGNDQEDGVRHLVLCRVVLGKAELVRPGSEQYHPSSDEFDSGVDDLSKPRKYIVWSTHMSTCVLPEYVVSFRAPTFFRGKKCLILISVRDLVINYNSIFYVFFHKNLNLLN